LETQDLLADQHHLVRSPHLVGVAEELARRLVLLDLADLLGRLREMLSPMALRSMELLVALVVLLGQAAGQGSHHLFSMRTSRTIRKQR
jgi:hypothetical protein